MRNFETDHEIVGKTLAEIRGLDIGSYYPVINEQGVIIGVSCAEFGGLEGIRAERKIAGIRRGVAQ